MNVRARVLLSVALVGLAVCSWMLVRSSPGDPAAGPSSRDDAQAPPPAMPEGGSPGLAGSSGAKVLPAVAPVAIPVPPQAPPKDPAAPLEPAHLTGIVRDAKTRAALFGARILVGVNERTMHDLRVVADPPLEARTDAEGRFALEVPVPVEGFTIRVDALFKGYRSLSGAYSSGAGEAQRVPVRPGDVRAVELELVRGFAVAGVVRDDAGSPIEGVQIEAHEEDKSSMSYVAFTRTDRDGRFEVYDFEVGDEPERDGRIAQARLHLDHPDFVPLVSGDLRAMTEADRTALELRMVRGLSIEGVVRTPEGGGAPGLLLEAVHEKQGWRRSVPTEADGAFRLRGVPRGAVVLRAADYGRRLVGTARVALEAEAERVSVDLAPIAGNEPRAPVRLLGLDLVDMSEAERVAFDFPTQYHVLVVGTGENPEALGIGRLEPGDCIWHLGSEAVPSLRAFAELLVSQADARLEKWGPEHPASRSFRIVYGMRREGGFAGTNTQGMRLSAAQVNEVRAWLAAQPK